MAHAFWHLDWQGHPWNKPTFDPRKSVWRDGRDVTSGGTIPLDLRNPYQIATDPRFQSGTGPGLGQVENPTFSASRQKGNIGKDMVGAAPRPEDWQSPFGGGTKDDDDWFKKMMQLSFMQSMMPEREGYSGTSNVRAGPKQRDFFDIPYYGSPYPGGTNV